MKTIKIAALTLSLIATQTALAKGIEVSLSTDASSITSEQDLSVNVTFTNTENKPLQLLKWYLPENNIKESIFKIKRDGQDKVYFGAHAKRPAPETTDYLILQPDQSVTYSMELSGMYDLSQTGNYDIQYSVEYNDLIRATNSKNANTSDHKLLSEMALESTSSLSSNVISIWVEGRGQSYAEVQRQAEQDIISIQGISYTGSCSNSEKTTLQNALSAANSITDNSVSYLQNESSNKYNPRFSTWFGSYNSSRWNTLRNNFYAIQDAIDNKNLTFDCSCNQGYYAYVYPSQPYKVYFCNAFWAAPMTGTDSKAGTIVHELSHFNVVAGTDDLAYGQTGAKNLSPSRAIRNADSHEYFAENTPYLY